MCDDQPSNIIPFPGKKRDAESSRENVGPADLDQLPSNDREIVGVLIQQIAQKKGELQDSDTSKGIAHIFLSIDESLLDLGVLFGLLHVRDGKDQIPDHGPLLNKEICFDHADRRKTFQSSVHYKQNIGFQFKCFVDYEGIPFQDIKTMLEQNGFQNVSRGGGKAYRAWFILPEYPTCHTIDGILNNFFYPA